MPLTEESRHNLQRFGCALQTSEKLILVNWTDLTREQALAASVLVRTSHQPCKSGPALCLALEISPTRILPRYSFLSFDLPNQSQMDFLSSISATNRLSINFLGSDFELLRNHELTTAEAAELTKSWTKAKDALVASAVPYDVVKITGELEANLRIPQLFERAVSETEFANVLPKFAKDVEKISPSKRALAHELIHTLADTLRTHWDEQLKKWIEEIPKTRSGLALLSDLKRIFGDDYEGFLAFFADAVAHQTDEEVLIKLKKWLPSLVPIVKLIKQTTSVPQAEQSRAFSNLGQAIFSVLNLVRKGRDLSLTMLQTLLLPLKPFLTGQPGRPPKDYSREYEWKKSMSWTQVTRRSLLENEDLREEFQGRTYDELTLAQQLSLMSRIREGVRSYAERTGKPFPIENAPD
jgi:hypothetical protein